jgi:heptosyltransferase-1
LKRTDAAPAAVDFQTVATRAATREARLSAHLLIDPPAVVKQAEEAARASGCGAELETGALHDPVPHAGGKLLELRPEAHASRLLAARKHELGFSGREGAIDVVAVDYRITGQAGAEQDVSLHHPEALPITGELNLQVPGEPDATVGIDGSDPGGGALPSEAVPQGQLAIGPEGQLGQGGHRTPEEVATREEDYARQAGRLSRQVVEIDDLHPCKRQVAKSIPGKMGVFVRQKKGNAAGLPDAFNGGRSPRVGKPVIRRNVQSQDMSLVDAGLRADQHQATPVVSLPPVGERLQGLMVGDDDEVDPRRGSGGRHFEDRAEAVAVVGVHVDGPSDEAAAGWRQRLGSRARGLNGRGRPGNGLSPSLDKRNSEEEAAPPADLRPAVVPEGTQPPAHAGDQTHARTSSGRRPATRHDDLSAWQAIRRYETCLPADMRTVRILVIRLSAIGDCVLASPVPQALRARFPGAHVTWVVEARASEVVDGVEGVDDVLIWRDHPSRAHGLLRALWEVRRRRFDVALDLQGLAKAGVFLASSGARRRITGSRSKSLARLVSTELVPECQPPPHAVRVYLRRAAALGIGDEDLRPRVPVRLEHRLYAARFLSESIPGSATTLVGFNIGASKRSKRWPPRRFAQVADALLRDWGAHGIIFGSPAEFPLARRMVAASRCAARLHIAAGRTSLLQMAALAERCATVVTTDSGPMHIAAAMGVPVVALFGPSQPRHTGPFGEGHVVVDAVEILTRGGRTLPPAQTRYGRRFGRVDDLKAIQPEHVISAAQAVWPSAQVQAQERAVSWKSACTGGY